MANKSDWLTELVKSMPAPCLVVDDGEIIAVNAEIPSLFKIPRNRLLGSPLVDFAIPEHQAQLKVALTTASNGLNGVPVRLAAGFLPMELTFRAVSERLVLVAARSMETEHRMSALAASDLTHDQVTGLSNRFHVLEELHHRLNTTPPQPMAVIGIWVDDLAELVNERGEKAAETVCRQVAQRIAAKLRGSDLLGRIQEDAFLTLLVTESSLDELSAVADRLRDEVSFPVEFDGGLVSFTASVMVGAVGTRRPSIERILNRLEAVSRRAAASGGNRTDILTL